jgi:hypothetical protein
MIFTKLSSLIINVVMNVYGHIHTTCFRGRTGLGLFVWALYWSGKSLHSVSHLIELKNETNTFEEKG